MGNANMTKEVEMRKQLFAEIGNKQIDENDVVKACVTAMLNVDGFAVGKKRYWGDRIVFNALYEGIKDYQMLELKGRSYHWVEPALLSGFYENNILSISASRLKAFVENSGCSMTEKAIMFEFIEQNKKLRCVSVDLRGLKSIVDPSISDEWLKEIKIRCVYRGFIMTDVHGHRCANMGDYFVPIKFR